MSAKKIILSFVKTVLPLALGIYLFWFFFANMSREEKSIFYQALQEANYFWIGLTLFISIIAYSSRAIRWNYVLEPLGYKTTFWNRYHAIMIGYLMNLTIPRAGEPTRSAMLFQSEGVPFSKSFGTIIAERAIDFVMLCTIGLITVWIGYDDFFKIKEIMQNRFGSPSDASATGFQWKYVIYGALLLGGLIFTFLLITKLSLRNKFIQFFKDVMNGVFAIFKSKQPFSYLFHTFVIWIVYLLMFALAFKSLPATANISYEAILMGFIAGSLGIIFTNGGIGSYPLLVGIVVAYYLGTDEPNGLAIGNALGMIIWTSQTILMIVLGLISLALLPRKFDKNSDHASYESAKN
ncbi:MAG: lysylphosphatidylglycerol synthase transmembrane domain-containing protein [Bacteroidota bacterium]